MQNLTSKKSDETLIFSTFSPPPQIKVGFSTKGRTKQSFKSECDINNIMSRFLKTGVLDFVQKNEARYADVTGIEYQTGMFKVAQAKTMFHELPAQTRSFFDNDPGLFLDFVQNPKNRAECEEMGLVRPQAKAEAEPLPVSHREDGSATHEPLRAPDGTYRVHTRKEKAAEKARDAAEGERAVGDKTNSST